MTKQEFLQLTHQQEIDDDMFNDINRIYMLVGYSKQDFCTLWAHDKEQLCYDITDAAYRFKEHLEDLKKKADKISSYVLTDHDDEAEGEAYYILGTAGAIKVKLANGIEPSDEDIEYINEHLQ